MKENGRRRIGGGGAVTVSARRISKDGSESSPDLVKDGDVRDDTGLTVERINGLPKIEESLKVAGGMLPPGLM